MPTYSDTLIMWVYEATFEITPDLLQLGNEKELKKALINFRCRSSQDFAKALLAQRGVGLLAGEIAKLIPEADKETQTTRLAVYLHSQFAKAKKEDWLHLFVPLIYGWDVDDSKPTLSEDQLRIVKPIFLDLCDKNDVSPKSLRETLLIEMLASQAMAIFAKASVMDVFMDLKNPNSITAGRLKFLLEERKRSQEVTKTPPLTVRQRFPIEREYLSAALTFVLVLAITFEKGVVFFFSPQNLFLVPAWFLAVDLVLQFIERGNSK
jgi:hypothetical protein